MKPELHKAIRDYRETDKGRAVNRYNSYKSTARGFIRNHATAEDLDELMELINERKK